MLDGTSVASAAGLATSGCKDMAVRAAAGSLPASRSSVGLATQGFVSRPDLTPPQITVHLREWGGPASGCLLSGIAQEIDVATGELLFEWDSHRHQHAPVPVGELRAGRRWRRHTWTLYKVSKKNGAIWRMGGKRSDFSVGQGSRFSWHHHVRAHGDGNLTVFDNGNYNPASQGQ